MLESCKLTRSGNLHLSKKSLKTKEITLNLVGRMGGAGVGRGGVVSQLGVFYSYPVIFVHPP